MDSRQRRVLWVMAAAALLAGFSLSVWWSPEQPLRVRGWSASDQGESGNDENRLVASARDGTELVVRYVWPDGSVGHLVTQRLPSELVGMSEEELRAARPEWRVDSFRPWQVVVSLPCQAGEEGFLGVSRGYVAVFDGTPGACSRLREVTDIALSELPVFQVSDLRRGIPFRSEGEKALILEGLRAH